MNDDVAWEGDSNDSWGDESGMSSSDKSNVDNYESKNKSSKTSDSGLVMFKSDRSASIIRQRKLTEINRFVNFGRSNVNFFYQS